MLTRLENPVRYSLPIGKEFLELNPLLGKTVRLTYTGTIYCINCNRVTRKSFNQGYCYPCLVKLAQCDQCIIKPELCHYSEGTCREPEWGEAFCFQPHVVYLANSSGVKVGITRGTQIPTRWIDQGAVQALPIFRVPSRHVSGMVEIALGKYVSDKTQWQKMLKNLVEPIDLETERNAILTQCGSELAELRHRFGDDALEYLSDERSVLIQYPVMAFPIKVNSFNLDKEPEISGNLLGMKGQYLIFDSGVINVRKYAGYEVRLEV